MTIRIIILLISVFWGSSFQVPPSLAPPPAAAIRGDDNGADCCGRTVMGREKEVM